ncbi:Transposase [Caligus rogercresseyi]|uniref:Transposase n=1 Tax=Caligus rogercresseyi TaxID=217165 RepID=A0A7T8KHV3_CALRO|nr:Transposase [Caligus rogercresseyi]
MEPRGTKLKLCNRGVSRILQIFDLPTSGPCPHPMRRLWTMESGALWKVKPVQLLTRVLTP